MGIDTLLVAVGNEDVDTSTYVETIRPLAESTGAEVLLAHVLSRDEAERAADRMDVDISSSGSAETVGQAPGGGQTSFYEQLWPGMSTEMENLGEASDDVVGQFVVVSDLDAALQDAGIGAELVGSVGDPGPEIARLADERGADLVVVGRRDRSTASQALLGSTSEEIVERSPVPVVVASE